MPSRFLAITDDEKDRGVGKGSGSNGGGERLNSLGLRRNLGYVSHFWKRKGSYGVERSWFACYFFKKIIMLGPTQLPC